MTDNATDISGLRLYLMPICNDSHVYLLPALRPSWAGLASRNVYLTWAAATLALGRQVQRDGWM